MTRYIGRRAANGEALVTRDGKILPTRTDLVNHSPDGFEWGYGGSGPAQLALAIFADHLGNDDVALGLYQQFKWTVVAAFPQDQGWELTDAEIEEWLRCASQESQR